MIYAKVVRDSISPAGVRLTTMELHYPRFIHAEFMTHRQFSRNASSSRAIPVQRLIEEVEKNPAMPIRWGLNGKGMQDHGEMSLFGQEAARQRWLAARDDAVRNAKRFLDLNEVPHKQIINRILEPFSWITALVTATEWENFFTLRRHPAAQPEIQKLAEEMYTALDSSDPVKLDLTDWHLPYVTPKDVDDVIRYVRHDLPTLGQSRETFEFLVMQVLVNISVARCARVSYLKHDGTRPKIDEDLALFLRLMGENPKHASPAEHQATPDEKIVRAADDWEWANPEFHGNLVGWMQYRKMLVEESVVQNPRTPKEVYNGKNRLHA